MKSHADLINYYIFIFVLVITFRFFRTSCEGTSRCYEKNGVAKTAEPERPCFEELQSPSNQEVHWELAEVNANESEKCPRLTWRHEFKSQCSVEPFSPVKFTSIFRGRTIVFLGDSMAAMSCRNLQDVLTDAGLATNTAKSSYSVDPFRRRLQFGCQEFTNGILICCGWIGFSNAKNEIKRANQNMFTNERGNLVNVLEPSDLVLWNFGIHHTRQFGGTPEDMAPFLNETLTIWTRNKNKYSLPSIWWKECYPQHFQKGYWYNRKEKVCKDISKVPIANETGIYNIVAEDIVKSFDIPIYRVYKAAIPLFKAHYRKGDCTHFCEGESGPMDHDNALLSSMIEYAIANGSLPELSDKRQETNGFDVQQRWDLLMEHPTNSIMAKLDVCANPKDSGKWHVWDDAEDGPMPLVLRQCLERTEKIH